MKGACVGRAISEKAHYAIWSMIQLKRKSDARRKRDSATNDRRREDYSCFKIGTVHRTPEAKAHTCVFAHQLAQYCLFGHASCDAMAVPSVVAAHEISFLQCGGNASSHCFLTHVRVRKPRNQASLEEFDNFLFKHPLFNHTLVDRKEN